MTKVICVDDDPNILAAHERNLRKHFRIETALSGELALKAIKEKGPFSVILVDMRMPGMDGVQFLVKARELAPDTVRVMLTGNNDQHTAAEAVNEGHVFRFITKPCSTDVLIQTLTAAARHHELITSERELLEQTLNGSVKLLTDVLSMADPFSFGRAQILREYCRAYLSSPAHLACSQYNGLATPNQEGAWEIELAAMVLSLGCVTIPAPVLQRFRGKSLLSDSEAALVERIPEIGSSLLENIPRLQKVAKIILYQNKAFDGTGFPNDRVKGIDIPFGSRVLKVLADLLELESHGLTRTVALEKMQQDRHLYDPTVLEIASERLQPHPMKSEESTAQSITLKQLSVRDVLLSPLTTIEGVLLVPEGTEISSFILHKIQNFSSLHVLKATLEIRVKRLGMHSTLR